MDADLAAVGEAWPKLTGKQRRQVAALVRAMVAKVPARPSPWGDDQALG